MTIEDPVFTCIKLICYDCEKGSDLFEYRGDNNLYHDNGNPCRAYRIRRHFRTPNPVRQVTDVCRR